MKKQIKIFCLLIGMSLLTSCAYVDSSDNPMEGYVFVVERAYKGASSYKYYVAPESKSKIKLITKAPVTNTLETIDLTTVSIGKAWPQGGVKYYTEGFACNLEPGTVVPKKSDSDDWDIRYEIAPYGTVDWKIWKFVCEK